MIAAMKFEMRRHGALEYAVSPILPCRHAFTTRYGGVSTGHLASLNLGENRGDTQENVRENYRRLCSALGMEETSLIFSRQVHGNDVRVVTKADRHALFAPIPYEADALVTNEPGNVLTIFTADCVPVLLCDAEHSVIGAAHCGWRSSVADMLGNTIHEMCRLGAEVKSIRAAIGPSIGACCFETGPEVPEAVENWLGADAGAFIRSKADTAGKFLVDLRGANAARLLQLGVPKENISISDECTMCKSEKYWSHRATKGLRGTQASLIVL